VFTPQESECDRQQDQPEQLNRATEIGETTQLSQVELGVVGTVDQLAAVNVCTTEKGIISESPSADNANELKNMLASVLDAIQKCNQSNK
jgi:hypothetical protein